MREATVGGANAIAHPLRGADGRDQVVGVVSVGRNGRPFTPSDRELFTYLAGQAARSMENVDLHETAARESVTDDLTGSPTAARSTTPSPARSSGPGASAVIWASC